MSRLFLFLSIALFTMLQPAVGQRNYSGYYDLINRAEEQFVVNNNNAECFKLYEKAFAEYSKPFAKDLFIASEIAYYYNDTTRFINFLAKCFDAGITIQCLHSAHLFDSLFTNNDLIAKINSLYVSRHPMLTDSVARDSIYMRFYQEQVLKRIKGGESAFYLKAKVNTEFIAHFFSEETFPSEQLIGLYSEDGFNAFQEKYHLLPYENQFKNTSNFNSGITTNLTLISEDFDLWNKCAFLSFIHYPCGFMKYKNDFWKEVEKGYVHPKDYAMLEEWFAKSIGNPNYLHDCSEERQSCYYNIIKDLSVSDTELLKQVEANRLNRYIQKYSVDVIKRQFQKEHGIVFFFGFFHYR